MRHLAVDPGASTGWALFEDLMPKDRGIARGVENFVRWIATLEPVDIIIYEDFRLFQHRALAQSGSRMEASQVIGILKVKAIEWDAKLVAQSPQFHKVGAMYSGKKPGAHKDSHDIVAYNHLIYYLVSKGLIQVRGRTLKSRSSDPESISNESQKPT